MRRLLAVTLIVSLASAALAGCGNKGPLVLPVRPQAPAAAASAPAPAATVGADATPAQP